MAVEEWRPIPGHDGYEISSLGRVRSYWKRVARQGFSNGSKVELSASPVLIMTPIYDRDGYQLINLRGSRIRKIARLVLLAFRGEPQPGQQAAHGNGIRDDNRLSNLRWASPKENSADAIAHGTTLHGSRVNTSKLSREQAREVFVSKESLSELARRYGVSPVAIRYIKIRRNRARDTADLVGARHA